MALEWNEQSRRWEWEGDVRGLVNAVGDGDARLGFVLDKKSGAKVSMNMNDVDPDNPELGPPKYEPFYIESPDGENLYDAYDRKEAVRILTNIRNGVKNPDWNTDVPLKTKYKAGKKKGRRSVGSESMGSARR